MEEASYRQGAGSLTLRQLAQHASSHARRPPRRSAPEQIDAKQPTVPA